MSFKKYLLKAITSKSKKGSLDEIPQKVLILRWNQAGGIGDTIILSFLFRELKKHFPGVTVDVLAGVSNYHSLKSNAYIDNVYLLKGEGFKNIKKTILPLRKKYDLVLDCSFSFTTFSLTFTRLLAPKVMIAVPKSSLKYGLKDSDFKMYDYILDDDLKSHWVEIYSKVLKLYGVKEIDTRYDFPIPDHEVGSHIKEFINGNKSNTLLLFNLFASIPERTLKETDAKELLDNIIEGLGDNIPNLKIVMTYPPDKREQIDEFVKRYNSPLLIASPPTANIYEVALLVRESQVVLSADTSITHLATAYDKPLVAIYRNNIGAYVKFAPRATRMHVAISQDPETLDGFDRSIIINGVIEELKAIWLTQKFV